MNIALITPSRGRPDRFTAMVASALGTAASPADVKVYGVIDADDPRLSEYLALHPQLARITVQGKREWLSVAFQTGAQRALADGADILMMNGDDVLFRTPGWDDKVLDCFAKYRDGLALVYPADGNGNQGGDGHVRGNHWFVTRRWVEVVGNFCPPLFEHFCSDTVPERIAERAGRLVYLPEVLVEHMHFKYKKAERDETYAYARTRDAADRSVSDRDCARMASLDRWMSERAAAVRQAVYDAGFFQAA